MTTRTEQARTIDGKTVLETQPHLVVDAIESWVKTGAQPTLPEGWQYANYSNEPKVYAAHYLDDYPPKGKTIAVPTVYWWPDKAAPEMSVMFRDELDNCKYCNTYMFGDTICPNCGASH
jgi:hypothetical protein